MINIGKSRECFFDDYLINTDKSTAQTMLHKPIRREEVLRHDAPGEGSRCCYHNFFYDDLIKKYRMYYLGMSIDADGKFIPGIRVCYAESTDGVHWYRPKLGIFEFNGSKENNIITDICESPRLDNFFVFRDDNPECPKSERYKAILRKVLKGDPKEVLCDFCLRCLVSHDGIHFKDGFSVHEHGAYDSLNTAFWDKNAELYRCFFRWNHKKGDKSVDRPMGHDVRDIRYTESKDGKEWSNPVIIDCGETEDTPLYTNNIMIYERAPQIMIGFPTRYIERHEWTACYDELPNLHGRKERYNEEKRYALALTDCLFMTSRDGINFKKYDEAIMTPGPERIRNWRYGDCYPAYGMFLSQSSEGADPELSFFMPELNTKGEHLPNSLYRYTFRCDGFVSRHAGAKEEILVTKAFIFDGSEMYANMSTSARGYIYFTIRAEDGTELKSCEMFGDSIDKKICFGEATLGEVSGKEVILEMRMLEADIYSIRFC